MGMKHVVSKDVVSGHKRIVFACVHCGYPHPDYPKQGKCRRCGKEPPRD